MRTERYECVSSVAIRISNAGHQRPATLCCRAGWELGVRAVGDVAELVALAAIRIRCCVLVVLADADLMAVSGGCVRVELDADSCVGLSLCALRVCCGCVSCG